MGAVSKTERTRIEWPSQLQSRGGGDKKDPNKAYTTQVYRKTLALSNPAPLRIQAQAAVSVSTAVACPKKQLALFSKKEKGALMTQRRNAEIAEIQGRGTGRAPHQI